MKNLITILSLVLMSSSVFAGDLECMTKIYERQHALNQEILKADEVAANPLASESERSFAVAASIRANQNKIDLSIARQLNMRTGYSDIDQACFAQ